MYPWLLFNKQLRHIPTQGWIQGSTPGNLTKRLVKDPARVHVSGKMVQLIKESGKMASDMARALLSPGIEMSTMVNGKMTSDMVLVK